MCNTPKRTIASTLGVSRNAVYTAISNEQLGLEGESKARAGAPIRYTDRDDRIMIKCMRLHPKMTFHARRAHTGLQMSNSYQRKLAKACHLHHWVAKIRPALTEGHARDRYDWCRARAHWTVAQWKEYIFSDECSAERGAGQQRVWVWGIPSEKWKPENVQTKKAGKQIRVMVWACFWGTGRKCPLYIMDRDFELKKYGYSARSYLEVLEANLPYIYEDGMVFMHDNASIHTAHAVRNWFNEHGIIVTDWPPYSPDLNPIEHAWKKLKETVYKLYPELSNSTGESEADLVALEEALKHAWEEIPPSFFESLVESMPRRVAACIEANGWHTKY